MDLENMSEDELLVEAKKRGFNPEYEGDNKKSPKEYLEVQLNHNKVLMERNEALTEQVERLSAQIKQVVEFTKEQKQKAVDAAIAKLTAQKEEAIADSDPERVKQLDVMIENEKKVAKNQNDPILEAWIANNPWYLNDEKLAIKADRIAFELKNTGRFSATDKDYEKLLKLVEEEVKSTFPDKFKNPKKDNPPEVESGHNSGQRPSKKSYADLPQDAKRACDAFVKDKIMTREQYLDIYEWD